LICVRSLLANRAYDQDDSQHHSVFGDVLAYFVCPEFGGEVSHGNPYLPRPENVIFLRSRVSQIAAGAAIVTAPDSARMKDCLISGL
jgi:hypothetical protein